MLVAAVVEADPARFFFCDATRGAGEVSEGEGVGARARGCERGSSVYFFVAFERVARGRVDGRARRRASRGREGGGKEKACTRDARRTAAAGRHLDRRRFLRFAVAPSDARGSCL